MIATTKWQIWPSGDVILRLWMRTTKKLIERMTIMEDLQTQNCMELGLTIERPVLFLTKNGHRQEVFVSEVFVSLVWQNNNGCDTAIFHFLKGCKTTKEGGPIERLFYKRDTVETIALTIAGNELPYGKVLRLCCFVRMDVGIFLISAYPNLDGMARQLVVLASHRPKIVALAQHFMATWQMDIYAALREK